MLVVIDACHSGDATRGSDDEVVRGVEDIFEAIKSFIWGKPSEKVKKKWLILKQKRIRNVG